MGTGLEAHLWESQQLSNDITKEDGGAGLSGGGGRGRREKYLSRTTLNPLGK